LMHLKIASKLNLESYELILAKAPRFSMLHN
jgi:hypothetical protein